MKKSAMPNPKHLFGKIKKRKPKPTSACSACKGTGGPTKGTDCKTCGGSGALFI